MDPSTVNQNNDYLTKCPYYRDTITNGVRVIPPAVKGLEANDRVSLDWPFPDIIYNHRSKIFVVDRPSVRPNIEFSKEELDLINLHLRTFDQDISHELRDRVCRFGDYHKAPLLTVLPNVRNVWNVAAELGLCWLVDYLNDNNIGRRNHRALAFAARNNDLIMLKLLERCGLRSNIVTFGLAAKYGSIDMINHLYTKYKFDTKEALTIATVAGRTKIAKFLKSI